MANPPAFQFYANDFITGTQDLEIEEVGIYIRLLCYQWDKGSLPIEEKRLCRIAGCDFETFKKAWVILGLKFSSPDGTSLKNSRLERTREEQVAYREKQRLNGIKGGRPRKEETQTITQTKPKNNPTVNPNHNPKITSSSSSSIIKEIYKENEAVEEAFSEFVKMRTKIKKPVTDRSEKMLRKTLNELSQGNDDLKVKIIERSILKNYLDFYPLDGNGKYSSNKNIIDFDSVDAEQFK